MKGLVSTNYDTEKQQTFLGPTPLRVTMWETGEYIAAGSSERGCVSELTVNTTANSTEHSEGVGDSGRNFHRSVETADTFGSG